MAQRPPYSIGCLWAFFYLSSLVMEEKKGCLAKILSPIVYWNCGGMILVVILTLVGVWVWMDSYTHHGESIEVPNVEGLQLSVAMQRMSEAGLEAAAVDSAYREHVAPGEVLDQHPDGGSLVKSGRLIKLTINTMTAPMVSIPDIADNCSRREAEMRLRAMGFKLTPNEEIAGDPDWVYAIKCDGRTVTVGQRIPIDKKLTLVVGVESENVTDTISDEIADEISNDWL